MEISHVKTMLGSVLTLIQSLISLLQPNLPLLGEAPTRSPGELDL